MLITYPNPILREKSKPVKDPTSPEIKELILEMFSTMKENSGLGLAAPQVGKSLRICVIKLDGKSYILINPKIKSSSWRKVVSEEGCLSFPGKFIPVKRSKSVKVKALNEKGEKIILKSDGMLAIALQHEIDHLDGKLFIDKEVKIKK